MVGKGRLLGEECLLLLLSLRFLQDSLHQFKIKCGGDWLPPVMK